jgi:peptidyl-prolyl cis-trans isomerase B (cyclophilin B)
MRRTRPLILAAVPAAAVLAVALGACGGDDEATTSSTAAAGECEHVESPDPRKVKLKPPTEKVTSGEEIAATVATNCGEFAFALDTAGSPKTASSFVHMVDEGLYDGTTFHRVVPGFVIQGGDPLGTGSGGPGYSVTERPPGNTVYRKGTVAMAKTSAEPPGTSGSQFFVVTAADAGLPPDYAVLGEVTSGEETIGAIEAEADPNLGSAGGPPLIPIVIDSITLS